MTRIGISVSENKSVMFEGAHKMKRFTVKALMWAREVSTNTNMALAAGINESSIYNVIGKKLVKEDL